MPATHPLRETTYVGVGLAVLAVRQANDALSEIEKRLYERDERLARSFETLRQQTENVRTQLEQAWAPYVERAQAQLASLVERLPEPAQKAYRNALSAGKQVVEGFEKVARSIPNDARKPRSTTARRTSSKAA